MKKSLLIASGAVLCSVAAGVLAKPGLDIQVVNTMEVMQLSKEGQEVVKEFEKERQTIAKSLETDQQKLMQDAKAFETKKATLTEAAARKERNALEDKESTFKRKVADAEATLREKMQERTEIVARSVEKSIQEVAEEAGADLIIDEMTGRVVYAKDGIKQTRKAIEKMDKSYEKILAEGKKPEGATKIAAATSAKPKATA